MSYAISWMPEAEKTFNENIEYLARQWTLDVINNFLDRVDEVIETIEKNPFLYPTYREYDNIRKCPVTKQITLFYRIKDKQVDLLTFWNNYQNPESLNL